MKPVIYVANVAESDLAEPKSNPYVREVMIAALELQSGIVTISAQVWHAFFTQLWSFIYFYNIAFQKHFFSSYQGIRKLGFLFSLG